MLTGLQYPMVQGTALGWIFSIFELATMVGTPITPLSCKEPEAHILRRLTVVESS